MYVKSNVLPFALFSCELLVSRIYETIILLLLYTYAVPTRPRNFTLETVAEAPTQLRASWIPPDPPNGAILNYTVRCADATERSIFNYTFDGDSVVVVLEGLSPYTLYSCNISATTSAGEGPSTDNETAQTDEAGTQPCNM